MKKILKRKGLISLLLGMFILQCTPVLTLGFTYINLEPVINLLEREKKISYFSAIQQNNSLSMNRTIVKSNNLTSLNSTDFLNKTFNVILDTHKEHIRKTKLNNNYNLWERRAIGNERLYRVENGFRNLVIKPINWSFRQIGIGK